MKRPYLFLPLGIAWIALVVALLWSLDLRSPRSSELTSNHSGGCGSGFREYRDDGGVTSSELWSPKDPEAEYEQQQAPEELTASDWESTTSKPETEEHPSMPTSSAGYSARHEEFWPHEIPSGLSFADTAHVFDHGIAAQVIVGYESLDLAAGTPTRSTLCDPAAMRGNPERRRQCEESNVLDEAVTTWTRTLRELTCSRVDGVCRRRASTPPVGCSEFVDEPCWVAEQLGRSPYAMEVHIGPTVDALSLLGSDLEGLDADGYLLFATRDDDSRIKIFIVGPTVYGTMFGVAGALHDWAGARWVLPGDGGLVLAPEERRGFFEIDGGYAFLFLSRREEPDFAGRTLAGVGSHAGFTTEGVRTVRTWLLRNRIRPHNQLIILDQLARRPAESTIESRYDIDHRMNEYLDPARYAVAHPDWYPNYRWYPMAGNSRVPITTITTRGARVSLGDQPTDCNASGCMWPIETRRGTVQGRLPFRDGFEGFGGIATMKPYTIVTDATGIRRFLPGAHANGWLSTFSLSSWTELTLGDAGGWKPCMWRQTTSGIEPRTDLAAHLNTAMQSRLDEHRHQDSASLAPSDGGGFCQCAACRALDGEAAYGDNVFEPIDERVSSTHTRRTIAFANHVAAQDPYGPRITTYAYSSYFSLPPDADLRPGTEPHQGPIHVHPRVSVIIANPLDEAEYGSEGTPSVLQRNVERWAQEAQARHFGIYDYMYGYGFLSPRIYLDRFATGLRHAYAHGARIFVSEVYPHFGMNAMQLYVMMQLLWDTRQDVGSVQREFATAAFGEGSAAEAMLDVYGSAQTAWGHHPSRWRGALGGTARFEALEARGELPGPGGLPWGYRHVNQFCPYLPSVVSVLETSLAEAERSACASGSTGPACRRVRFSVRTFRAFTELARLRHARTPSDLGPELASGTVAGMLERLGQGAAANSEIGAPPFYPIPHPPELVSALDGHLAALRSGATSSLAPCPTY